MQPLFCFTLDTEPDNLWANLPTQSYEHFSRLYRFHCDLTARGARPTYLTTSEVVERREALHVMRRIREADNSEIGAHFHSWTRSWPFDVPDLGNPPVHANAHRLGQVLEEQMLDYTCRAIESAVGVRPVSYRGGRWSLSGNSIKSMVSCGIRIDTTVTPGISWRETSHPLACGPDYREFPREPFWLAGDSLEPRSSGEVLELPVGASFVPNRSTALSPCMTARAVRKLCRALRRPYGVLWLRPTVQSRVQMKRCMALLQEDQVAVWVAMIHSSEIVPCRYFPTEDAVTRFRKRCLTLVEDALQLGARCATLKEVRDSYE